MKTVKELIDKKGNTVFKVHDSVTIKEALTVMKEKNIGALLVLNQENKIEGLFSERDLARHIAEMSSLNLQVSVSTIMTRKVYHIDAQRSIDYCMTLMTEKRARHLPVTENGKLYGLISIGDTVKELITDKDILIDQLENYISGSL
jgi:signal-transduction protein with cAMP-binding, CBS, and nucleotidyltransferase domain